MKPEAGSCLLGSQPSTGSEKTSGHIIDIRGKFDDTTSWKICQKKGSEE